MSHSMKRSVAVDADAAPPHGEQPRGPSVGDIERGSRTARAVGSRDQEEISTMDVFVCPECKGALTRNEAGCTCQSCATTYPVRDNLPCFNLEESTHGEFSEEEMGEFLRRARNDGWKAAISSFADRKDSAVGRIILDETRTNHMQLFDLTGNEKVLDLGCGFGGISRQLSGLVGTVVSIDNNINRVEFLKIIAEQENLGNVFPACNGNITKLPFEDNYFDIINLIGVFEYFTISLSDLSIEDAQSKCLDEVCRILKPGGHLYLGTKNRYGWNYLLGGADHNNLRFGPVLPRSIANRLCLAINGRPYRIIIDSIPGYRNILTKAKFDQIKFFWPFPSYQFPKLFLRLDHDLGTSLARSDEIFSESFKKNILVFAARMGLLKFLVPHFAVKARKRI